MCINVCLRTENYSLNLVKLIKIWIVITLFLSIWHPSRILFGAKQSKKCNYNPKLDSFNKLKDNLMFSSSVLVFERFRKNKYIYKMIFVSLVLQFILKKNWKKGEKKKTLRVVFRAKIDLLYTGNNSATTTTPLRESFGS